MNPAERGLVDKRGWSADRPLQQDGLGEKWDHLLLRDLDGDGDLDVVGNVEEHYRLADGENRSYFSVVWFENPSR